MEKIPTSFTLFIAMVLWLIVFALTLLQNNDLWIATSVIILNIYIAASFVHNSLKK